MIYPYTRKTAPTLDLLTIDDAKQQCRISTTDSVEDDALGGYIRAATQWVEDYTGRSLLTQTWQMSLPAFPCRWWLPRAAPLSSVTFVKYYDTANALQTLSSSIYYAPAFDEPASVALVDGQTWPNLYDRVDAVRVEYVTGASSASAVPAPLRQAVQLLVGHYYANREQAVVGVSVSDIPFGVTRLCAPYRLFDRAPEWT